MGLREWWEEPRNRASALSIIAGFVFGAAWWLYIDGTAIGGKTPNSHTEKAAGYTWLPGAAATIAFIMCASVAPPSLSFSRADWATG